MTADVMWQWLLSVVNHLWQSTLVAAAAWVLCRVVLANNHPRVRFVVWFVALLKFLVPFSWFVDLGRLLRMPAFVTTTQSQQVFELVSGSTGSCRDALNPVPAAHPRRQDDGRADAPQHYDRDGPRCRSG